MTAPQLSHVQSAAVSPDTTPLQEDNMEVNFPTTTLGFNSLPPEIRNRIYRMLFVGNPVELIFRANNSRSAALLATCKEIEREGSSILYGENVFCFRPRFYNIQGNLTAYEVVQNFFETIGPKNISMLRDIGISFEDTPRWMAPNASLATHRYVNDQHLRRSIQLLANHSQLEHIMLHVSGGRRLRARADARTFLDELKKVKVNRMGFGHLHLTDQESELQITDQNPYPLGQNLDVVVRRSLERAMIRPA